MKRNISIKKLTSALAATVLATATLMTTGCSKISTSDQPPTTVNEYIYNFDNSYFRSEDGGETKFIVVDEGSIKEIENYYFDDTYSHGGLNYRISFTYSEHNKKLVAADMLGEENNAYFLKVPSEQERCIFICLNTLKYNIYPVMYDVKNCSIRDVLAGTGAEELWISDFVPSPDFKKFLLVSDKDETVYLCKPHEKSLSDMKVLTGVFDFSGALWADPDNLILTKTNENGNFETWVYNVRDGESKMTTDKYTPYNEETGFGLRLYDTKYALNITEKGKVQSVDLTTGVEKTISGYTYSGACSIDVETHNRGKFLLVSKMDTKSSIQTAYLLDLKEGTILKKREIPSEFKHVAYFDENNLIAYTSEDSYSVYYMGE
ncbi:MAG: hypothetical protein E7660_06145 [Ruminococcaceae bacterium]|nr:hypothetical protein [Oscillospiraceae bacterium]